MKSAATSNAPPHTTTTPLGSHYWVSVGEEHLFSPPLLGLRWERLLPAVNKRALSGRGRDNVVHNPVITTSLLWLAFIKLRREGVWGGCSFKDRKVQARQRRLRLPKSLSLVCLCEVEMNYSLSFIGLVSLLKRCQIKLKTDGSDRLHSRAAGGGRGTKADSGRCNQSLWRREAAP